MLTAGYASIQLHWASTVHWLCQERCLYRRSKEQLYTQAVSAPMSDVLGDIKPSIACQVFSRLRFGCQQLTSLNKPASCRSCIARDAERFPGCRQQGCQLRSARSQADVTRQKHMPDLNAHHIIESQLCAQLRCQA